MNDQFFKISFFILLVVMHIIRLAAVKKPNKKDIKRSKTPIIETTLFYLNIIGVIIIPLFVVFGSLLDFAKLGIPSIFRWLALFLYAADLWFFYWTHKALGRNWSGVLEIKKNHELIKTGPYKKIRHPMYTAIWIFAILQGVILDNWIVMLGGIGIWALTYFIRVPKEEQMMIEEFGDKYKKYMKETGRIFPKI